MKIKNIYKVLFSIWISIAILFAVTACSEKPDYEQMLNEARQLIAEEQYDEAERVLNKIEDKEYKDRVTAYRDYCEAHLYTNAYEDWYYENVLDKLERIDTSLFSEEEIATYEKYISELEEKQRLYQESQTLSEEEQSILDELIKEAEENREKANAAKEKQSSSNRKKPQGSSHSEYDLDDFVHPEDFYDWYKDDFVDLEDAENYWDDHQE